MNSLVERKNAVYVLKLYLNEDIVRLIDTFLYNKFKHVTAKLKEAFKKSEFYLNRHFWSQRIYPNGRLDLYFYGKPKKGYQRRTQIMTRSKTKYIHSFLNIRNPKWKLTKVLTTNGYYEYHCITYRKNGHPKKGFSVIIPKLLGEAPQFQAAISLINQAWQVL